MTQPQFRSPAQRGMSLFAGAVGIDGFPVGCRAVALTADDDLSRITVYVPMATSSDLVAGVAATKRLAVVATYPRDHFSIQLKGLATGVRLAADHERELIRDAVEGFAEVLHAIGQPLRVVRAMNHWPAFAIDLAVDAIFDQTPGPQAGKAIR
jgi:hypothetical protein